MPAGSTAARPLVPASQRWHRRCQEATAHCQQRCGQVALAAALPAPHSCTPSGAAQQAALCALLRHPQRHGRTGAASGQRQSQRCLGAAPAATWLCPPAALAQNRERIGAQARPAVRPRPGPAARLAAGLRVAEMAPFRVAVGGVEHETAQMLVYHTASSCFLPHAHPASAPSATCTAARLLSLTCVRCKVVHRITHSRPLLLLGLLTSLTAHLAAFPPLLRHCIGERWVFHGV
jgi:hypothetical protein